MDEDLWKAKTVFSPKKSKKSIRFQEPAKNNNSEAFRWKKLEIETRSVEKYCKNIFWMILFRTKKVNSI